MTGDIDAMVSLFRAAAKASHQGPGHWYVGKDGRRDPQPSQLVEDEAPEPPRDPFPVVLGYGRHRCVCGGATRRHASNWWCSNPACRHSRPVENEADR
jgi:hypothetical protein